MGQRNHAEQNVHCSKPKDTTQQLDHHPAGEDSAPQAEPRIQPLDREAEKLGDLVGYSSDIQEMVSRKVGHLIASYSPPPIDESNDRAPDTVEESLARSSAVIKENLDAIAEAVEQL